MQNPVMPDEYYLLPGGEVCALSENTPFPDLSHALTEPNGLLAIGGALSEQRLLAAYQQGIFPWFSNDEPVMWWSPHPRMVLFPNELKISKSFSKVLKKQRFDNKINSAFRQVITACATAKRPDQDGTWINTQMINAYCHLHDIGHALCAESWLNGDLVGGCYGVIIGHMFYGESMFHTHTDASKVAFVHLVKHLEQHGVGMIDCQMKTPLLSSFGGREIPRDEFIQTLKKLINLK